MANELIVKELIDRNRQEIVQRLPTYLNPTQFFALAYALEKNPRLKAAAQRAPDNLIAAIFKAADMGLNIGSAYDHCTLIPYGDEIQVSVGYHGLIFLLKRAGAVLKIDAACVYEGDHFKVKLGDDEGIEHEPNLHDDTRRQKAWLYDKKNILGAYAIALLPDPLRRLKQHRWCPLGEIEAARLKSKVPDGPAWKNEYPEMAKKTAIRRLCKLIEVCGPTEENREAWERYGRTIEVEKSNYHNNDEDEQQDPDMPGERPAQTPPAGKTSTVSGRRVEASGGKNTPPPQNGGGRKAAAPPPPPPEPEPAAPPIADEPISEDMQNKLFDLMKLAGMRPTALFKYVKDTYGVASLEALKASQATDLEKYLKSAS